MALSTVLDPIQEKLPTALEANAALRVLIVEDDPFTLTILQKRLSMGGYTVATATNGYEGLNMVEEFRPDLIISDWMMPELDGREFCARVKQDFASRSIYFVLLTAKDKHEDKVLALDTGADEYLVKPCDGQELMARLRAAERILRLQQSVSLSNGRLQMALARINAELEATSKIQRCLLPKDLPIIEGYGFAAYYQPSTECSGDFYEVFPLGAGLLGIAIGDVSGHGAPSMVTMALTHTLLHQEAAQSLDPSKVLFNLNNKMCTYLPTDQYVTVFYGILDPLTGLLTYSSAGHNPPLKIDYHLNQFEFLRGCEGFPIKLIGPDMEYENSVVQIAPDQHLILYTDGLLEAFNRDNKPFGSERLIDSTLHTSEHVPQEMLRVILENLRDFMEGEQLQDDLSMFILSRQGA